MLAAGALGSLVVVGVSVAVGGWGRLVSPLTYQRDRGLQVESLAAAPAMVARAVDPGRYVVTYSDYRAYEVFGPGVQLLLVPASIAVAAYVVLLAVLWARLWVRRSMAGPAAVTRTALAAVTGYVATSKVFSPQYVQWLLPLAAAGLSVTLGERRLRRWTVVLLVSCATTLVIYPIGYQGLVDELGWTWLVTAAMVLRSALVVWLGAEAFRAAWAALPAPAPVVPQPA